jgi:hypothetical protein
MQGSPRFELLTSWDEVRAVRAEWDRLWAVTPCSRHRTYFLDWVVESVQGLQAAGHPWCIVERQDGRLTGIAPLYVRPVCETRLGGAGSVISFMPLFFGPARHSFLCGGDPANLLKGVVQLLDAEPHTDRLALTGLPFPIALRFATALDSLHVAYVLQTMNAPLGGGDGLAHEDLLAIKLPRTWEEFVRSRSRSWQDHQARRWRAATRMSGLHFWRRAGGVQISGSSLSPQDMTERVWAVHEKAWQKGSRFGLSGFDPRSFERLIGLLHSGRMLDLAFLFDRNLPIAYYFGTIVGRFATANRASYNTDYRRLSPGALLDDYVIRTSIEQTCLAVIDFFGSPDRYKHRLADLKDTAFRLTVWPRGGPDRGPNGRNGGMGRIGSAELRDRYAGRYSWVCF